MSIPLKLIYNNERNGVANALPSDRRNINIIHGVKFGAILTHIHNKNKDDIDSWINGYKNKLTEYLNKNPQIWNKDPGKYCTNLNYIIDFIVQGINNLKMIEGIRWALRVQEISRDTLRKITSSKCTRDLDNFENKNLLFKKLMLDLCEDIEFIKKKIKILPYNKCLRVISRLKYRNDTLMKLYHTFVNKSIFDLKDKCSISFIYNNLSNINCNKGQEQPSVSGSFERGTVTASSSAVRADTQVEGKIKETKEEEALETESLQDSGFGDGLDNTEPVDPNLEDLQIGLPDNEDPPKLDTTYAAASLAGVSLFGTILYKYGPFRNRLNSRRGGINGSNIFPIDNNVYDANIMNNFEYLQTGIPNDQYQLGYGSITDY